MLTNLIKKNNFHLIVIFLGLILSVALSTYYISKYDKYNENGYDHQLIKDETYYHWTEGAKIAEEVAKGKNFFLSGDITFTKPLHQRIIGLYSLITGYNLVKNLESDNPKISLEGKLPFLILQAILYFLSLFYFSKKLFKVIQDNAFLYIIFFLSLELTIFQFHSSFFTESIYFSLQLIIFANLLEKKENFSQNLLIGILLGLLFLQRSAGIFYIIPILFCYLFLFKTRSIKPFIGIISGYTIILILLGSYNYYKTNVFYIVPSEGKYNVHTYFSVSILSEKLNISKTEALKYELNETIKWAKKNDIKFNKKIGFEDISGPLELSDYFFNESDKNKFFDYINYRQYEILINNPLLTLKKTINNTMHFLVFDPTFNYFYNEHRGRNPKIEFVYTNTHKKLIPLRIIYTLVIYFFCIIGFIFLLKKKKYYELSLTTLSILYYVILLGWKGDTRLYVPSLIYMSIFFGLGLNIFINNFKKKIK